MAKSKDGDDVSNKLLWIAGGALVSAGVMYYVNKHLREREELQRLKYAESQKQLDGGGDS